MDNYITTYEEYIELDREYREYEHLLDKYTSKDSVDRKEYISKKYGVDDD